VIGQRCILQAGSVIGSDGFGYALESDGSYKKIPQLGNVILEDDVEVGANTTIDRAVIDATIIRRGVKLDNLIQIAHNVEVGHDTVMAAQVGIAGSTKVGSNCSLGGQAGLSGHINIGSRTQIGAQSGIMRDLSEGSAVLGSPAMPVREYFRSAALFNKFSEIYQTLNRLERELGVLRGSQNKSK
jgi:UDP-3-O-[3-hydroxymyristoyl] glucosamine N-acyltransferase